jgi:pseudouridine-5'-phosphate glycosidase
LSDAQIETLAADKTAVKVSVRDLPLVGVRGLHGGTTVAATALLAHRAGIRVFATGGIGGVHRGHPEDISADLPVLASTPIVVVCAGAKSILDLPRTLEYLETWGVPVLGWQTDEFPAFYSRESGLPVDVRVTEAAQIVQVFRAQRTLHLPQGLLVTAPIPGEDQIPAAEIAPLIARAVAEAEAQGVVGRAITPFLLARLVTLSEARSRAPTRAYCSTMRVSRHRLRRHGVESHGVLEQKNVWGKGATCPTLFIVSDTTALQIANPSCEILTFGLE